MTYENEIFKTIQSGMQDIVENATLESIDQTARQLKGMIDYAKILEERVEGDVATEQPVKKEVKELTVKKSYPENTGILKRKLVGGTIHNSGGDDIYMSEKIIRENHFKEGDLIHYRKNNTKDTEIETYWFSLEEEYAEDMESQRREFKDGYVQADEKDRLYVQKSALDDPLEVDGEESPYVLTISEREAYNVKEGDYIDLAWYSNDPHATMRVIWVHRGE